MGVTRAGSPRSGTARCPALRPSSATSTPEAGGKLKLIADIGRHLLLEMPVSVAQRDGRTAPYALMCLTGETNMTTRELRDPLRAETAEGPRLLVIDTLKVQGGGNEWMTSARSAVLPAVLPSHSDLLPDLAPSRGGSRASSCGRLYHEARSGQHVGCPRQDPNREYPTPS